VYTCIMTRMQCAIAPGTAISLAQMSGTSPKPIARAVVAGNVDVRSVEVVKSTLITSSCSSSFRFQHQEDQFLRGGRDLLGRIGFTRGRSAQRAHQGRGHDGIVDAISSVIPTASINRRTSLSDNCRDDPGDSVASWMGPMRVRTSRVTSWPIAEHIRRT